MRLSLKEGMTLQLAYACCISTQCSIMTTDHIAGANLLRAAASGRLAASLPLKPELPACSGPRLPF